MKTNYALPLAVFAGVLIGVAGGTIHAQQAKTPPGYVIAEVAVTDPATMQKYGEKVPETLTAFNHHYVIRDVAGVALRSAKRDSPMFCCPL
jgi:hypothetical protein